MKLNSLFAPGILFAVLLACNFGDPTKKATPAADLFHKQYDAKQFTAMYDDADDLLKKSVTKAQFQEALTKVFDTMGKIKNAKQTDEQTDTSTGDSIVRLSYNVEFENGSGTEKFTFKANGGHVNLVHYNVDSPLLR